MRRTGIVLGLFALAVASCDPVIGPPDGVGEHNATDLEIARVLLEEDLDEHQLFLPPALLDQVATAVARLRPLDDVTAELLTPPTGAAGDAYSEVGVAVFGDGAEAVALRAQLAACPEPFALSCWPELAQALDPVGPVTVRRTISSPTLAMVLLRLPARVDRFGLVHRLDQRLSPAIAFRNEVIGHSRTKRLVREGASWRFIFSRGYGDCPAGCIANRYYEYLYDPERERGWKDREYGAPWPPAE
jgi:hypothetical protein